MGPEFKQPLPLPLALRARRAAPSTGGVELTPLMRDWDVSHRSGISPHYMNEWSNFGANFKAVVVRIEAGLDAACFVQNLHIKRYAERFPPEECPGFINEHNRARVQRLDELVSAAHQIVADGNLSQAGLELFRVLEQEAERLIYGR